MKIKSLYIILITLLFSCAKEDNNTRYTHATVGHKIQFINIDSYPSQYNYLWDFGDGHISNEEAPSHIYKLPGTYSVNVTRYKKSGAFLSKDCFWIVEVKQIYRPRINEISIKQGYLKYLYINNDIDLNMALSEKQALTKNEYSSKLEIEDGTILYSNFDNWSEEAKCKHMFTDTGYVNVKFSIFDKNKTSETLDTNIFIGDTISRLFLKIPETYNSQLGTIKEKYCIVYDPNYYSNYNEEYSNVLAYKYDSDIMLIKDNEMYNSKYGFYLKMYNLKVFSLPEINNNEYFSVSFLAKLNSAEHYDLKIIIVQIGTLKKAIGIGEFSILPGSMSYHNVEFNLYDY